MNAVLRVKKVNNNYDHPGHNWGVMFTGALIPVFVANKRTWREAYDTAFAVATVLREESSH